MAWAEADVAIFRHLNIPPTGSLSHLIKVLISMYILKDMSVGSSFHIWKVIFLNIHKTF